MIASQVQETWLNDRDLQETLVLHNITIFNNLSTIFHASHVSGAAAAAALRFLSSGSSSGMWFSSLARCRELLRLAVRGTGALSLGFAGMEWMRDIDIVVLVLVLWFVSILSLHSLNIDGVTL